uniref:hypothetical protein n=1 Tax=Campylobacter pinnipediorum TaxID=1965231 RepID=UPI00112F8565
MKISMIASATIIGAMMAINVYGDSSLDGIKSAQTEKSDFIKKLEEASKDGYLDKLKKAKDEIEQQKKQVETTKTEAENAKNEAEQAKTEAENQKKIFEYSKKQAETAKTAAETAKTEYEKQKTAAETQVEKLFEQATTIKNLNNLIEENIKVNIDLQKIINKLDNKTTIRSVEAAVKYLNENFTEENLKKLYENNNDFNNLISKNTKIILLLDNLKDIGVLKFDIYHIYFREFDQAEADNDKHLKLEKKLQNLIGSSQDSGLRKLCSIMNQIEKKLLADELTKVSNAQENLRKKQKLFKQSQEKLIQILEQIKKRTQEITQQEQLVEQKTKEIEAKEKEITEQTEKIAELEQLKKQAKKELKQAKELVDSVNSPEAKAKVLAELESKIEEAKKDRAKSISKDKDLKFDNNEAQTVLSLLSVANNEQVNNLLLKTEAEDIANLAKNINNSLEEVAQEFKNNQAVDTLLSNVGSAINSRLAKLSNPLNDDLALA